ncbi:hypothetical protein QEN19_000764 [Hanseniaspora menglaensis]
MSTNKESKFKIIKHSVTTDGKGIVHKANRNGIFTKSSKDDIVNNEINENEASEDIRAPAGSSLKPFIEKIISSPLHFIRFNNSKVSSIADSNEEKYIIIGDKIQPISHTSNKNSISGLSNNQDSSEMFRPKSLAESLLNYITPKNNKKEERIKKRKRVEIDDGSKKEICLSNKRLKTDITEPDNIKDESFSSSTASDSEEITPINSDHSGSGNDTPNEAENEDLGEDLDENLDEDLGEDLEDHEASKQNQNSILEPHSQNNLDHQTENTDSTLEVSSHEEKTAVSTPETDVVAPELNSRAILKQKLEPPLNIETCSLITLNLASDHGSKLAPYPITKNWLSLNTENKKFYPKGLINHGVTCYINSAIQAMLHIPAIQNYLMDLLENSEKYPMISNKSVTWQLAETSKKMWSPTTSSGGNYFDPKKLINRLPDINCMMSEWEQEDSHEYFMSLMSRLQEDSVPKGVPLTQSIIHQIFGGKFKQSIKCGSCNEISVTEQMFYDLSVVLSKKKKTSKINLNNCIEQFFQKEKIVDGYNCDSCKASNKNSEKNIKILEEPEYLVIHLKKYKFDGLESHKMKQKVNFNKYLDVTNYKDCTQVPSLYQLTSVVCHSGRSLSSGHYIAHTLQPDQSWATYDDDYINKISEVDVLDVNDAYYLVYAKLTPKTDLCEIDGLVNSSSASVSSIPSTPVAKKKKAKQKKLVSPSSSPCQKNGDHKKVLAARLKLFNKNKDHKANKKNKKYNSKGLNKFKH